MRMRPTEHPPVPVQYGLTGGASRGLDDTAARQAMTKYCGRRTHVEWRCFAMRAERVVVVRQSRPGCCPLSTSVLTTIFKSLGSTPSSPKNHPASPKSLGYSVVGRLLLSWPPPSGAALLSRRPHQAGCNLHTLIVSSGPRKRPPARSSGACPPDRVVNPTEGNIESAPRPVEREGVHCLEAARRPHPQARKTPDFDAPLMRRPPLAARRL